MINAKQEFLSHVEGLGIVRCAVVRDYDSSWRGESGKEIFLKNGFTEADFEDFLDAIDFEYDDGYGGQELYGFIWYEDGTWSERYEYDGSECWDYKKAPKIPAGCK